MYKSKDEFLEERFYEDYNAERAYIDYQERLETYRLMGEFSHQRVKNPKHYSRVRRKPNRIKSIGVRFTNKIF